MNAHRDHGLALAWGTQRVMAELFGKANVARGKGGSMHMFDAPRHSPGGYGIVGGQIKVPWVDAASGALVAMERCRFGLFGDRRVIDGVTGARFIQTFQGVLESPMRLVVG